MVINNFREGELGDNLSKTSTGSNNIIQSPNSFGTEPLTYRQAPPSTGHALSMMLQNRNYGQYSGCGLLQPMYFTGGSRQRSDYLYTIPSRSITQECLAFLPPMHVIIRNRGSA